MTEAEASTREAQSRCDLIQMLTLRTSDPSDHQQHQQQQDQDPVEDVSYRLPYACQHTHTHGATDVSQMFLTRCYPDVFTCLCSDSVLDPDRAAVRRPELVILRLHG